MKHVVPIIVVLIHFAGCAELTEFVEEASPAPSVPAQQNGSSEQEIRALLKQPYIDPLTNYIHKYHNVSSKAGQVKKAKAERDKRCRKVADKAQKKKKNYNTLANLKKGYNYSCPQVVANFAALVKNKASPQTKPPAQAPKTEKLVKAKEEGLAKPEKTEKTRSDKMNQSQNTEITLGTTKRKTNDCYLLFKIKNYTAATKACVLLAQRGDANAQHHLGAIYKALKQYKEALRWTRLAVAQGLAKAQYILGEMHYHGYGISRDYHKSYKWFRLAAQQGLAEAQYSAGLMLFQAKGVPQDYKKAMKWLLSAAKQGVVDAQIKTGMMFLNGQGRPQNNEKAAKWFRMAAEQGGAEAQLHLGMMYAAGKGVPKDQKQAYVWVSLAALGGKSNAAAARNKIAAKLVPAQLDEARRQARKIAAKYNKKP